MLITTLFVSCQANLISSTLDITRYCVYRKHYSVTPITLPMNEFRQLWGDAVACWALSVSVGCTADKTVHIITHTPDFFFKSRRSSTWIFHSVISGPIRCSYTPTPYTHLPYLGHTHTGAYGTRYRHSVVFCPTFLCVIFFPRVLY